MKDSINEVTKLKPYQNESDLDDEYSDDEFVKSGSV